MKQFLLAGCIVLSTAAYAQDQYWQQSVDYKIDAALNDKEKTIQAKELVTYTNNSPDALSFIWFHIWPNAYKNRNTALFKQIDSDVSRKEKEKNITYGHIDGLAFKVNGIVAKTSPHPNPAYIDIIKLNLPRPLKPGETIKIETPFKVKLPSYFSRSGFAEGEFMATQWYPKPAVYDRDGWHEFPYLDMGEYYSEYANYNVSITLPSEYVVGATGVLQNNEELQQYKTIGARNAANRTDTPALYQAGAAKTKMLNYIAKNVPDFAWFAGKDFVVQYDTLTLPGKTVDAFTYYHNKPKTEWANSIDYVKDAVQHYSNWIGEYEYPVVQAFEGPKNNSSGGMEYPMITIVTEPDATKESLDGVITHEVGHNWFMSMLGSNERQHTWQDEGLNTYYQFRYEAEKYRYNSIFKESVPAQLKKLPSRDFQAAIYGAMRQIPMQTPIDIPAADFKTSEDYGLTSYLKTAMWMYELEKKVGRDGVDKAFQQYFKDWHDKHIRPVDMKTSFEKALGMNLDDFFAQLKKEGPVETVR